jgi:zinc protease
MHRLFFLLLFPVFAFAQTLDVKEHMLKNGMRVLLVEDHTVPSICFFAYYRVGSRNEKLGYTGLSHLFEHMMFNGSKNYKPGEIDRILEAGGGYSNASTWNDLTNYWEEFNPDLLEKVLDIEADRMRALKLDKQNIEQERGIVMEERRVSMDNNVQNRMVEELYANAFVAHPYQNQVIGWMGDLANIKLEDAQMYFKTYYAPNNCTVILTGDFQSGNALALIKKYLEPLAAQKPPREPNNPEPEQQGEKRIKFYKVAQLPAVLVGYKSVAASDSDYVVADVLGQILSRGESSRLYKRLVYEKQMCTEASGGQDEYLDPGLFTFYAQMKEGFTTEQAEQEIYSLLETVQKEGVKPEELQKAKNNAQADFVRRFKTNQGIGFVLGYYQTIHGNWKKALTAAQAYDNVTNDRLKAFAKRIFNERKRTVVTLFPETTETN